MPRPSRLLPQPPAAALLALCLLPGCQALLTETTSAVAGIGGAAGIGVAAGIGAGVAAALGAGFAAALAQASPGQALGALSALAQAVRDALVGDGSTPRQQALAALLAGRLG